MGIAWACSDPNCFHTDQAQKGYADADDHTDSAEYADTDTDTDDHSDADTENADADAARDADAAAAGA